MSWQLSALHNPDAVIVRASHLRSLLENIQALRYLPSCNPNDQVIAQLLKIHTSAIDLRDFLAAFQANKS